MTTFTLPNLEVLALVLAVSLLACDRSGRSEGTPESPSPTDCDRGFSHDPARAGLVRGRLGSTARGRSLLESAREPLRICFSETTVPSVTTEGVFVLDPRIGEAESAARLGHLLLHRSESMPFTNGFDRSRPCSEVVAEAISAEARAHALELELRHELGVTEPTWTFPFESDFWAAVESDRVELLRAYFRAHPNGGDGVPGFVDAYTRRCEADEEGSR